MSPVDMQAGTVTGTNFALGSYEKCQPGFRDEETPKILRMRSGAKFEKRSKHGKTQSYNFRAYHNFATPIAVSLLLNGMLMMWKIQQAKQDDVIRATLLPCCFLRGYQGEVFIL